MKKILNLSLALLIGFSAFAQRTTTRSLSSFSEISAHEGIEVYLKKGAKEEARIEASGLELSEVLTEVSGGKLKIHLEKNSYRNIDVTVWVTYKSLNAVSASSAAEITGEDQIVTDGDFRISASSAGEVSLDVRCEDLDISASSAGEVALKVKASDVTASASSAGSIEISGSARSADVEVSSSGDFEGYDLSVETADMSASSGGSADITVSEQLNARASSGGSIRYKGNPRMDVSTSSGGSVRKS